jgi:N-succinyldiaminopimelate aminotransferase
MPRYPSLDPKLELLGGSVFSSLAPRISELEGEIYPLHVGDTWMDPDPKLHWRSLDDADTIRPHRYCDPHGVGSLLLRLVEKLRARNGIEVAGTDELLITAGATGALCAAATATLSPGDEVLLLAPYWPLIRGIVINAGGRPVEVPVLTGELDVESLREAIEERITPRTAAIYLSTPSNPTGRLLDEELLQCCAEIARAHDLWIWSDEVYEHYAYTADHLCIATMAPERTLTVFSFSKAYGMAGYRCGYLVGPRHAVTSARRIATYVWYSVPTPSQLLAVRAIEHGEGWIRRARESYRRTGDRVADMLGLARPEGGTFLFMDVASRLDDRGLLGFLEDCLEDNLVLAPGSSFGADYGTWVRVCFTCSPPEVVIRGVEKLARRVGVGPR